jgi:alpha-L-fucosidase
LQSATGVFISKAFVWSAWFAVQSGLILFAGLIGMRRQSTQTHPMKKIVICLLAVCLVAGARAQTAPDLKYGMFIHWGLLPFTDEMYQGFKTKDYGSIPAEQFAPTGQDAAQWAKLAKDGGMTFAVMVVKHEDGFCLWPSAQSDYTVAQSPCKLDLAGDFIKACQAEGIVPGFDYSLVDCHSEGAFRDKGPTGPLFFNLAKGQIVELLTRYPDLRILMVDDASKLSPEQFQELVAAAKAANPQCYILGDPKAKWGENFGYASVLGNWFWQANEPLTPMQKILNNYYRAQAGQTPFLLNVSPDRAGHIEDSQVAVVKQVKELIDGGVRTVTVPDAPAAAAPARPDAATRLKQVKALYDQGLINKEDYDMKVKEILDSM